MKKFLCVTSLLIVAMMLFSVVPASASTQNAWEAPAGIQTYYANDISGNAAPVIDGQITDGEYGSLTVRMTRNMRLTYAGESTGKQDSQIDNNRANQPASDAIDFYFAYDAEYIYIAMKDLGGTWEEGSATYQWIQSQLYAGENVGTFATRNNYHFNTGFFLDDCTSYFSMQASSRGFDENKWYDYGTAMNGNADSRFGIPTSIVDEAYIKKSYVENGEVFADAPGGYKNNSSTDRGNVNQYAGQYQAVIELKYRKSHLISLLNELYFCNFTELPNAMWFWFVGRTYAVKETGTLETGSAHSGDIIGYNRYFANDIRNSYVDYSDIGIFSGSNIQAVPGLIVFGDENTDLSLGEFGSSLSFCETYGHTEAIDPAVAATCTQPGLTQGKHCWVCDEIIVAQQLVPALGHNYTEIVTSPTCTQGGYTTHTCTVCSHSYTGNSVPSVGHSYTAIVTAPTCAQNGYTTYSCSVCNHTYMGNFVPSVGHNYTAAVTAPTCTQSGYTTHTCSVCNHSYMSNPVSSLGHTEATDAAVAPTCTETGLTEGNHCSVCNEVLIAQKTVDALGHTYDNDKDATCNVCTQVREIETEAPTTDTGAADNKKDGCKETVSIAGLALVIVLGTCAVFVSKKKEG